MNVRDGDDRLGQRRLRPARPRRRARERRQTAYKLGITTHLDGIPAEGIGGLRIGVTPLEQADAYATFADGGVHHPATAIAKVVFPNGDDRRRPSEAQSARVISDGIAYEVTDILKGVITAGTGAGYTDFGCPAAGKTGTTEGQSDAWFVGYTPRISTAVWVGHPDSRASTGFGGPTAGPIWHAYMEAAHGSYCGDFPQPQNPVQFSSLERLAHRLGAEHAHSSGGTGTSKPVRPSVGHEQRQVPAQPVRAGRRPGARSEPRGQRRRRRGASGQLRRRRRRGPGLALRVQPRRGRFCAGAHAPRLDCADAASATLLSPDLHRLLRSACRSDTASLRRSR